MAKYKIKHITHYFYKSPVYESINQIMLYPIQDLHQTLHFQSIRITDSPSIEIFKDHYFNQLGIFNILKPHSELSIQSNIVVEVVPIEIPNLEISIAQQWEEIELLKKDFTLKDFLELEEFKAKEEISNVVKSLIDKEKSVFENAFNVSKFIFENFTYKQGVTTIESDIDEVWSLKAGVCQDFAHLLLEMLQIAELPSRYVSGYICPKNHDLRGEGATHAWVEVFLPTYGWIGIDPTNNCLVSDRHVRLAVGKDFHDCTPVKGIYKGSLEHRLEVTVVVENTDSHISTLYNDFFNDRVEKPSFVSINEIPEDVESNNSYWRNMQMQQQQQQ
ncbi:transglutaminase domain-containing protein [Cloacibacterium sp.]|uniref:transglutaminase family protein n=1 Tax=Cloacibacterium sp. TaxID=1913682 RepID=UPI0035ADD41C